jgi:hypothetical protein
MKWLNNIFKVFRTNNEQQLLYSLISRYLHALEKFKALHHIRCKCVFDHEWDTAIGEMWCSFNCPKCGESPSVIMGIFYCPFRNASRNIGYRQFSLDEIDTYISQLPYTEDVIEMGTPNHDKENLVDFYEWLCKQEKDQ